MARNPRKPPSPVPRCNSCGEEVAGLGKYCSGCGVEIEGGMYVKYAEYLGRLHRVGMLGSLVSSKTGEDRNSEVVASPTTEQQPTDPTDPLDVDNNEVGERGVFTVQMTKLTNRINATHHQQSRRRDREKMIAPRPPPSFKPADGPILTSTPLKLTRVSTSPTVSTLSKTNRPRYKREGSISFVDPSTEKTIRIVGRRRGEGRLQFSIDKRNVYVYGKISYHNQPPAISAGGMFFHLPEDPTEAENIVAKLMTLVQSQGLSHSLPSFPDRITNPRKGDSPTSWLSHSKQSNVSRDFTDKIVRRLHDDFIEEQRLSAEHSRKQQLNSAEKGIILTNRQVNASNTRLYYQQLDKKRQLEERLEKSELPFQKTVLLDPEGIAASTNRLYLESVEKEKQRQRDLVARYLPAPPRIQLSSSESLKESVQRLYYEQADHQVHLRKQLWQRHVTNQQKKSKKITKQELVQTIERLSQKA